MRVRRVSQGRQAEVKSPNQEPQVHPEVVLKETWHAPEGFETWDQWLAVTASQAMPAAATGKVAGGGSSG